MKLSPPRVPLSLFPPLLAPPALISAGVFFAGVEEGLLGAPCLSLSLASTEIYLLLGPSSPRSSCALLCRRSLSFGSLFPLVQTEPKSPRQLRFSLLSLPPSFHW